MESAIQIGPDQKKPKLADKDESRPCKHYVKRKKRFCKMTVAKGKEYCGEHLSEGVQNVDDDCSDRIPCPLDPKHTLYSKNLRKHLRICNARPKEQPTFIVPGINSGPALPQDPSDSMKLSDFAVEHIHEVVERVEKVYREKVERSISECSSSHKILATEVSNAEYSQETRKHLLQASSILGCLQELELFNPRTSFVDFGSGKGQLSYWLAKAIEGLSEANVVLVDRASHRHKKDNKIEDKTFIHRIRADIADFDLRRLDLLNDKDIVVVSKHLCGIATDLALQCILKGLVGSDECQAANIKCFLIALCCHHQCQWQSFVGREEFTKLGFDRKDFNLMTKLVSWAVSGSGVSRERRRILEEQGTNEAGSGSEEQQVKNRIPLERRAEIGKMCKRFLDYCRLCHMQNNNFKTSLKYYVKDSVTLENVCIIGEFAAAKRECK